MAFRFSALLVSAVFAMLVIGCGGVSSKSKPGPTPGPPPDGITAVNHVVILLQENRSFDHYDSVSSGKCHPYQRLAGNY
jgi:phospholipase C